EALDQGGSHPTTSAADHSTHFFYLSIPPAALYQPSTVQSQSKICEMNVLPYLDATSPQIP
ncbi:MAG: hypothetical protein AAGD05_18835, partial [Bacteroidota bacterium]